MLFLALKERKDGEVLGLLQGGVLTLGLAWQVAQQGAKIELLVAVCCAYEDRDGPLDCHKWGCNTWGFKGCLLALSGNQLKSAFFSRSLPFSPFSGEPEQHLGNPENREKRSFSSDILCFG